MSKGGERVQGVRGGPIPYGFGISRNPVTRYDVPANSLKQRNFVVTGVTKDSTGSILGDCKVDIFETASDILRGSAVSDSSTGVFTVFVNAPDTGLTFYGRAYKVGSPDVAGTTVEVMTVTEL